MAPGKRTGRKIGPVSGGMARKMGLGPSPASSGGPGSAGKPGRPGKSRPEGAPGGPRKPGPGSRSSRPARGESAGPEDPREARPRAAGPDREGSRGKPPRSGKPAPGTRNPSSARPPRPARPERPTRAERPAEPETEGPDRDEDAGEMVWGRHAVIAALRSGRPLNKVWLQRSLEDVRFASAIRMQAREAGVAVVEVDRSRLEALVQGPHQGVVASLAPVAYRTFAEVLERARGSEQPLILLLEGVEDPHNLGALIRSAEAAGAQGVVIPQRRAVGLTGVVAKAAAGALDLLPVARVVNMAQAIRDLQGAGFWVVAADGAGEETPWQVDMRGPIALVVGSEGRGLSKNLLESCDHVVRLPMPGKTPSLNASVAGGIMLFEVVRQRS